jgi:hypothetical protein
LKVKNDVVNYFNQLTKQSQSMLNAAKYIDNGLLSRVDKSLKPSEKETALKQQVLQMSGAILQYEQILKSLTEEFKK